jgi:hypothetical protein
MRFMASGQDNSGVIEWGLEATLTGDMTVRANGIAVGYFSCVDGSFITYALSPGRVECLMDMGFRIDNQSICIGNAFL